MVTYVRVLILADKLNFFLTVFFVYVRQSVRPLPTVYTMRHACGDARHHIQCEVVNAT